MSLEAPLTFRPVYKVVLWGGRRLERWRSDLPPGPVGESWDVADHGSGMSVVDQGPLAGESLHALVAKYGESLVGQGFRGDTFPLMVKLIDATDRLSVQVHPDDTLAQSMGVGVNGKTESWFVLEDGGEIFQGTRPGVDRQRFEEARASNRLEEVLNRFEPHAGDCFFLAARTVHALGAGCLVYELQQTSDVTYRVHDWGRVGADGKPRALHVAEALQTIDFGGSDFGPRRAAWSHEAGRRVRTVADCSYFRVREWELSSGPSAMELATCAIVTCLNGQGVVATQAGQAALAPGRSVLVPAAAMRLTIESRAPLQVLVATPTL